MKRLIYGLLLVAVCLGTVVISTPAVGQTPSFELSFWPGSNVERDRTSKMHQSYQSVS